MTEELAHTFVEEVGHRLRAIRRQQRLSLEDVEQRSGGRWSASAIGAYERGYRNLSLGRLRELAEFYGVPMSFLVGEIDLRSSDGASADGAAGGRKVTLDLAALERLPEAAPVYRYAHAIAMERGDYNGRVISLRHDDVRMLGAVYQLAEAQFIDRLREWAVLADAATTVTAAVAGVDLARS
jgi:transcriptional regulator with XRE-family HTH domain